VNWFTDRHFFLLAVLVYGVSTVYSVSLWRKGFRKDNRVNYLLLLAGFGLQVTAMSLRGFSLQHCPVNNLFEATMFVDWTIVTVYLVVGLASTLRFLGAFVSPVLFCLGVFALMPALDPPHGPKPEFTGAGVSLHAALILQAYGAFGLGAVAGLMYLSQEHNLKFHKLRAIISMLPPIQKLELISVRLLRNGFILLTIGLAIGALVLGGEPKAGFFSDVKVIWSLFVWAIYLGLLVMHWKFDQSGRRFAWGAVAAFVFVLLTFWGTSLLSPLHHHP
jgi:HemX protein